MSTSVYIETTIPSAYFETRTDRYAIGIRALTREWWEKYAPGYRCVTSKAVLDELSSEDYPQAKRRDSLKLIQELELLPITEDVVTVAETYIREKVMPQGLLGDALHLALASFHHARYLLTWNCRHLANPNKIWHIRKANGILGLPVPDLCTPAQLMRTEQGA